MAEIKFVKSITSSSDIPANGLPEIVLCGRSNVGKSSFINSFFNRKDIAKISSTPGKTRTINYFNVEDKFHLVDLPGFGYAKVAKTEQKKWAKMITDYFANSSNILLAMHLIDSRHKPTILDVNLRSYLENSSINYKIILTKADKLKQSEQSAARKNILITYPKLSFNDDIFLYSATKGYGKKELRKFFSNLFSIKL